MPEELVHRRQMLRLSFREPVPAEASVQGREVEGGGEGGGLVEAECLGGKGLSPVRPNHCLHLYSPIIRSKLWW